MSKEEFSFKRVGAYDYTDKDRQQGYAEMIHCINCADFLTVYIPHGIKKKDYLSDKPCQRCKCVGTLY